MTNDLQIIKELQSRSGEFEYEYEVYDDKVLELELDGKGVKTKDLKLIGELTSLEELCLNSNNITEIKGLDKLNS